PRRSRALQHASRRRPESADRHPLACATGVRAPCAGVQFFGGAGHEGRTNAGPENVPIFRGGAAGLVSESRRVERETGFEPATPTLARSCSTTELFPRLDRPTGA